MIYCNTVDRAVFGHCVRHRTAGRQGSYRSEYFGISNCAGISLNRGLAECIVVIFLNDNAGIITERNNRAKAVKVLIIYCIAAVYIYDKYRLI